jgi:hypothetical protein
MPSNSTRSVIISSFSDRTLTNVYRNGTPVKSRRLSYLRKNKKNGRAGRNKKYTVTVDLEKVGKKPVTAIMTFFADPKETEEVVAKKPAEMKEAVWLTLRFL